MSYLRYLGVLALTFWIGGLAAIGGVAASTTFASLERQDPAGGRVTAGIVFGDVFSRFSHAALIAGGIVIASLALRAALGPRPRRFGVRMWVAAAMVAGTVASIFVIQRRIETIRASVSGAVASLPDTDPRKAEFGRWHGISSGVMLFTILAGAGLLWIELDDKH